MGDNKGYGLISIGYRKCRRNVMLEEDGKDQLD